MVASVAASEWIFPLKGDQIDICPSINTESHIADKLAQWEPGRVDSHPIIPSLEQGRLCVDVGYILGQHEVQRTECEVDGSAYGPPC